VRLNRPRGLAVSLMTDTAEVLRPDASPTLNTTTGVLASAASASIYDGPCRVRTARDERHVRFGERLVTTNRFTVWFPWDAPILAIGDLIEVASCTEEQLTGSTLRVTSIALRTHLHFREITAELNS
jgi:hypothetical protein